LAKLEGDRAKKAVKVEKPMSKSEPLLSEGIATEALYYRVAHALVA
jgi:hypothetical protein